MLDATCQLLAASWLLLTGFPYLFTLNSRFRTSFTSPPGFGEGKGDFTSAHNFANQFFGNIAVGQVFPLPRNATNATSGHAAYNLPARRKDRGRAESLYYTTAARIGSEQLGTDTRQSRCQYY